MVSWQNLYIYVVVIWNSAKIFNKPLAKRFLSRYSSVCRDYYGKTIVLEIPASSKPSGTAISEGKT